MKKTIKNLSSLSEILPISTPEMILSDIGNSPTSLTETLPDTITIDMIKEPDGSTEIDGGKEDTTSQMTTEPLQIDPPKDEPEPKEIRKIILTTNTGTMTIIHPDDLGPDEDKTPISKRGNDLLLIGLKDFRTSGLHPNGLKNPTIGKTHPKWMIQTKRDNDTQERWTDLPKERGWNLKEGYIILTRTQTTYKNLSDQIIGRIQEWTEPTTTD